MKAPAQLISVEHADAFKYSVFEYSSGAAHALSEENADAASSLKFQYKLGFADSFAAELAMRTDSILVTADPEFAKLGKRLKLLALPRQAN